MQTESLYRVPIGYPQRRATDFTPGARIIPFPAGRRAGERELSRLHHYLRAVAKLVIADPVYMPIFARLETMIAVAEAKMTTPDPVAQARAIIAAHHHTHQ